MKKILVIDDDKTIADYLKKYLEKNNFEVGVLYRSKEAIEFVNENLIDLIVCDLMMPDESGLEFIERFRLAKNETPVIMLTALGEVEHRITGLSTGADDYLGKPFEPEELLLRIHNILKKTSKTKNLINFNLFKFDEDHNILYKNENIIPLTSSELELFKILYKNKNKIISRDDIVTSFNNISERSVDVQINRLRQKIEDNPKITKYLKTIRNKGYILNIE